MPEMVTCIHSQSTLKRCFPQRHIVTYLLATQVDIVVGPDAYRDIPNLLNAANAG